MNESTLFSREEMNDLDWLARNVHVWPDGKEECLVVLSRNPYPIWSACKSSCGWIERGEWLARRADLQNKPSWDDAPEWAEYMAQSPNGHWEFFAVKPRAEGWWRHPIGERSSANNASIRGAILGDWRDTLEKRPEQAEFEPFVSVEDAATAKQPDPKGSGNPILGMVLADLTNRALEGKERYGEPLLAHNGRNALWDLYQELLDAAMYIRQAIEEQK